MATRDYAWALAQAQRLRHHLNRWGVPVSIELQKGAGGGHWAVDTFRGVMNHHIVSSRASGPTPGLNIIKRGRAAGKNVTAVPGPLANWYLGFDGVVRIITMGLANHPGAGGPFTIDGWTIPRDNGRYYLFGGEIEGGLRESDWPPEFHRLMARIDCAIVDWLRELRGGGVTDDAVLEHSSWTTRKIDRLGYDRWRRRTRAEIAAARSAGPSSVVPSTKKPVRPVREVQLALAYLGYYDAGPGGVYLDDVAGPFLRAAIIDYQKAYPSVLRPDADWGQATDAHWKAHHMTQLIEDIARASAARTTTQLLNFKNPNNGTGNASVLQLLIDARAQTGPIRRGGEDRSLRQEVADILTIASTLPGLLEAIAETTGLTGEEIQDRIDAGVTSALRRVHTTSETVVSIEAAPRAEEVTA